MLTFESAFGRKLYWWCAWPLALLRPQFLRPLTSTLVECELLWSQQRASLTADCSPIALLVGTNIPSCLSPSEPATEIQQHCRIIPAPLWLISPALVFHLPVWPFMTSFLHHPQILGLVPTSLVPVTSTYLFLFNVLIFYKLVTHPAVVLLLHMQYSFPLHP